MADKPTPGVRGRVDTPPADLLLSAGILAGGGVWVLVGSLVFKTSEGGVPALAGSIPVRLRCPSELRVRASRPSVASSSGGGDSALVNALSTDRFGSASSPRIR